jgi:hypothetical protein
MSLLKLAPATEEKESIANALGYADGVPEAEAFGQGISDKVEALSNLVEKKEIRTAGQILRYLNDNFTTEEVLSVVASDLSEFFRKSPFERMLQQMGAQE